MDIVIPESPHITVARSKIENIVEGALPYYTTELLYHGSDHAVGTVNEFLKDYVLCKDHGLNPNLLAGVGGSAFHDADYHKQLTHSPYRYKEERSAAIATENLPALGLSVEEVKLAAGAIEKTRVGTKCENLLDRMVRRADIANISWSYPEFLGYFMRYAKEQRKLTGKISPFEEVKEVSLAVLASYISDDLSYGEFDKTPQGLCVFVAHSLTNLLRFNKESEANAVLISGESYTD